MSRQKCHCNCHDSVPAHTSLPLLLQANPVFFPPPPGEAGYTHVSFSDASPMKPALEVPSQVQVLYRLLQAGIFSFISLQIYNKSVTSSRYAIPYSSRVSDEVA